MKILSLGDDDYSKKDTKIRRALDRWKKQSEADKKEEFEIIRNEHGDQVNIQFPQKETGSNEVKIRGPGEWRASPPSPPLPTTLTTPPSPHPQGWSSKNRF